MHIKNELGNASPSSLYFDVRFFTKALDFMMKNQLNTLKIFNIFN